MKTRSLLTTIAAISAVFAAQSASAVPIRGSISFDGNAVANGDRSTATEFVDFSGVETAASTSTFDYSSVPDNTPVTMTPFKFDPGLDTSPTVIWTFTAGGKTYDFLLENPISVDRSGNFLEVWGFGTARITGLEDTPGTFGLSTQGGVENSDNPANFNFTFSSTTEALPDQGGTVALLGMALLGFGGIRKFLKR